MASTNPNQALAFDIFVLRTCPAAVQRHAVLHGSFSAPKLLGRSFLWRIARCVRWLECIKGSRLAVHDLDLLPSKSRQLLARHFDYRDVDAIVSAIQQTDAPYLGISLQMSAKGDVEGLAFATANEAFYLKLQDSVRSGIDTNWRTGVDTDWRAGSVAASRIKSRNVASTITNRLGKVLAGFQMARIALHLHRDVRWHVKGIDLSTLLASSRERTQYPSDFIYKKIDTCTRRREVDSLWYRGADNEDSMRRTCLRAWVSAVCANADHDESVKLLMQSATQVNTNRASLDNQHLSCLEEMVLCTELLENEKPVCVENEFNGIVDEGDGLRLENARFKNRVRKSNQTSVVFHTESGMKLIGQATSAAGRQTSIQLTEGRYRSDITRVTVHGREELTVSESARDEFVLRILQGTIDLTDSLFIDRLWFPQGVVTRADRLTHSPPPSTAAFVRLNQSQKEVAAAMLSPLQPIVIAHGPPGTGKTSTIAAATDYWMGNGDSAWIIAQSNVGVKNIARSLVKKGITDFRLIVSKEFFVDWHEHLYEEIMDNIIRSDDLSQVKDAYETERFISGGKILLCTLSMLSNPVLDQCHVFKIVPMLRLVVDEASQINAFEYMHLFHKFKELEKVCFFGDPKQLPPFGQDAVPQLQSIFNIKHLKPTAYFLNTQYRMPVPLGDFISREVYNSKLLSSHTIRDSSCIALIDVSKGTEVSAGKSWTNAEEVRIVVKLVQDYYRSKDYCVITPYDAQRAAIVKALETAHLPSEKVYNVDSFQGHEAQYVIVSATRTTRPGFLALQSRTNVMLTRCSSGMIIVSNRSFVSDCAERTLLGKLVTAWRTYDSVWIDWRRIIEGSIDLPGVPAPHPRLEVVPQQTHAPWRPEPMTQSTSRPAARPSTSGISTRGPTTTAGITPAYPTRSTPSLQSLPQQMAQLHLHTSTNPQARRVDDFPNILAANSSAKQPALQGQWRRGSKPVRLG